MSTLKKKNAHIWERDEYDWYVEPIECSMALLDYLKIEGLIWDPACGMGNIISSCEALGLKAFGSDIVRRNAYCSREVDFLSANNDEKADHIVSNPPFGVSENFVRHALKIMPTGSTVSMILPLVWASGFSTKRSWLPESPLKYLMPISPRPSMPPGAVIVAGEKPGNGTKDFAWFTWEIGYSGPPHLHFLNTNDYRPKRRKK